MLWTAITDAIGQEPPRSPRGLLQRLADRLARLLPGRRRGTATPAFTTAFVALAAKMAKADGVAVDAEAAAFERFIDPADAPRVRRLYDLAKQDTAGYEIYAKRIGHLLRDEPETKRSVLECLMYVACSDGILHAKEEEFLRTVAAAFAVSSAELRAIRCQFVRDFDCPFEVLGLPGNASPIEVKARYRRLAYELHPDRMIARGEPFAVQKAASARLAQINVAYETIAREWRAA